MASPLCAFLGCRSSYLRVFSVLMTKDLLRPTFVRGCERVPSRSYVVSTPIRYIDFKLDEKTAHSSLDLFKKDTAVIYRFLGIDPTKVPQNPERFREWAVVFGDTSVTSGKHYWEVTVKKSEEFRIGVADIYMSRDECIGANNCSWTFASVNKKWYAMLANKMAPVSNIGNPERVGLLLDCDAGTLSLVDVEQISVVHTIGLQFKGPVIPAFALWNGELLSHSGLEVPENLKEK
ncbi:SPRY domain-containing protein 4 [Protopterus annectens]|uniref:SPRY domain-containing protein 4 n=1 Tax=Protopterus annectens TaxID=7888 RepID=UPI001CF972EC|nr:SPRY domain-containing protein 4 [Protopterus annectens]